MKVMAVDRVEAYRASMTLERCFSIMIQPCVVEVGIGRVSNQSANCVWRLALELFPLKVPEVRRSCQYWKKLAKRVDDKKPTRETLTLASFRRKKRKKQEPWVPRGVKHKLSWLQRRFESERTRRASKCRVASGKRY